MWTIQAKLVQSWTLKYRPLTLQNMNKIGTEPDVQEVFPFCRHILYGNQHDQQIRIQYSSISESPLSFTSFINSALVVGRFQKCLKIGMKPEHVTLVPCKPKPIADQDRGDAVKP